MDSIKFMLEEGAKAPLRQHQGDAGWDLFTLRETIVKPRAFTDVQTGVRIQLPSEVYARITGRSSTVRTWQLQTQEGIIDTGYTGPLFVGIWNLRDEDVCIPAHTRLAQVIFHLHVAVEWERVLLFGESERGDRGFGSTGG